MALLATLDFRGAGASRPALLAPMTLAAARGGMACLAGLPAAGTLLLATSTAGGAPEAVSVWLAGQSLAPAACAAGAVAGWTYNTSAVAAAVVLNAAFSLAVGSAASRRRSLQAGGGGADLLGLAAVFAGGPLPASLTPIQRTTLTATLALTTSLTRLPSASAAGVVPPCAFGSQMSALLVALGAPAAGNSSVVLTVGGVAYWTASAPGGIALLTALLALPDASTPTTPLPLGAIIGGSVGGAVLLAAIAIAALLIRRRRRAQAARARLSRRVSVVKFSADSGFEPDMYDDAVAAAALDGDAAAATLAILRAKSMYGPAHAGIGGVTGAGDTPDAIAAVLRSAGGASERRAAVLPPLADAARIEALAAALASALTDEKAAHLHVGAGAESPAHQQVLAALPASPVAGGADGGASAQHLRAAPLATAQPPPAVVAMAMPVAPVLEAPPTEPASAARDSASADEPLPPGIAHAAVAETSALAPTPPAAETPAPPKHKYEEREAVHAALDDIASITSEIAGLMSPPTTPSGWEERWSRTRGAPYWRHTRTGIKTWLRPVISPRAAQAPALEAADDELTNEPSAAAADDALSPR